MLSHIARGVLVLLGGVIVAHSQVEVTLQLPFAQQMPPQVAEWRENESLIRVVVQNTGRERYTGLMISAELQRDGRRIATTRNGHPAQPRFDLSPGEVRTLSWREVIAEAAIEYDRSIAEQVLTTGELPAGSYQLCLQVLDAGLRPIGRPGCGTFTVIVADAPVLLSPIGGAQASETPLLQWSPSSPPAPGLQYRVTLKVRYQGQTPAQAMASNPIRLQVDVPTTSYQVPVTEQLGADAADPNYAGHVWQVQALLNGRPYGRNQGLSPIEHFAVLLQEVPSGTLCIEKFEDRNGNGQQDPGEPLLGGWSFLIVNPETRDTTRVTTGTNGTVCTRLRAPDVYIVTEQERRGWRLTTGNNQPVVLERGMSQTVRFGNQRQPGQPQPPGDTIQPPGGRPRLGQPMPKDTDAASGPDGVVHELSRILGDNRQARPVLTEAVLFRQAVLRLDEVAAQRHFENIGKLTDQLVARRAITADQGRAVQATLKAAADGWWKKLWELLSRAGGAIKKILKKLPIGKLIWIVKYGRQVVECYTYCFSLDQTVLDQDYGGSVWNCIDRCLRDRIGEDEMPVWHAIKDLLGLNDLKKLLDWLKDIFK